MNRTEVKIPEGWTYFIHGTNSDKWNINLDVVDNFITTSPISCISEEKAKEEQRQGANTTKDYSRGKGKPFEIRCLIYRDCIRQIDKYDLKSRLSVQEIDRVAKYHFKNSFFGRHECIPKNTRMIKIAKSEIDKLTGEEKKVFWFVPEEFYDRYLEDCEKYPDRNVEAITKDKPLPSWNLDGYNLTKVEKGRIIKGAVAEDIMKNKMAVEDIKEFTQKEYSGDFSTNSIVKLEDKEMIEKILLSQGIDSKANIGVFLVEHEDKEMGGKLYQLYMRDRKGNIKPVKLPTSRGKTQLATNRQAIAINQNGNTILSQGIIKESPLSWALPDGTELNVLLNNNQLEIGKTNKWKTETLKSTSLMKRQNCLEKEI